MSRRVECYSLVELRRRRRASQAAKMVKSGPTGPPPPPPPKLKLRLWLSECCAGAGRAGAGCAEASCIGCGADWLLAALLAGWVAVFGCASTGPRPETDF